MLLLTRRNGEAIVIGDNIRITVVETRNGSVKFGVEAPRSIEVWREEIKEKRDQKARTP